MGIKSIGILGAGFVGRKLYQRLSEQPDRYRIAFVYARRAEALDFVPAALRLTDLDGIAARGAELVVEAAHADITRSHGRTILRHADYMPMSVTALADPAMLEQLQQAAREAGHRMLIPHGAAVAIDSLLEWRDAWKEVTITFRKPPNSIDFSRAGIDPATLITETVVYQGSVRGAAERYPRNVNAMVTTALASVGVERCQARLVADPEAKLLSLEIDAVGHDGTRLSIRRQQPAIGVSGTEMFASLLRSIEVVTGDAGPLCFV